MAARLARPALQHEASTPAADRAPAIVAKIGGVVRYSIRGRLKRPAGSGPPVLTNPNIE
jgi:hypothetical protein